MVLYVATCMLEPACQLLCPQKPCGTLIGTASHPQINLGKDKTLAAPCHHWGTWRLSPSQALFHFLSGVWQCSSTTTPPSSLAMCACIYLGHVRGDECANTFWSVGTGMQMPQSMCRGQKTPFRCQPSPFYPDWGSFSTAAQAKLAGPQAPLILLPQPLSWARWCV